MTSEERQDLIEMKYFLLQFYAEMVEFRKEVRRKLIDKDSHKFGDS